MDTHTNKRIKRVCYVKGFYDRNVRTVGAKRMKKTEFGRLRTSRMID